MSTKTVVGPKPSKVAAKTRTLRVAPASNKCKQAKLGNNPHWHYDNEPETRAALDLIFADYFSRREPATFPIRGALLTNGDDYMHLADPTSYVKAQDRDRTTHEYTTEIWKAEPCPIP